MIKLEIMGENVKFNSEKELQLFCILKGIKPEELKKEESKETIKYKFNKR